MKDSKQLLYRVEQEIAHSQKTSTTAAGRPKAKTSNPVSEAHIDSINQVFALFRINYHNQYHAAFGDTQTLNQAKKLWAETLLRFPIETILHGAKRAIEQSEYLPTLHKMISLCQSVGMGQGLVDPHTAYIEACRAPSPKASHKWSHAAVYHAGKASDWYMLANSTEKHAFPIFKEHYQRLCQRIFDGETLTPPEILKLPEKIETPLSKSENQQRLKALKAKLEL